MFIFELQINREIRNSQTNPKIDNRMVPSYGQK